MAKVGKRLRAIREKVGDVHVPRPVGDVIALTTRLDDPINLTIEELGCAKARLRRHEGQLAVRLESLTLEGPKKETRPK